MSSPAAVRARPRLQRLFRAAGKFFSEGGSPKTGHPTSPPGPSSLPEIVSDHISRDGAWMSFRFLRALPTGGPPPRPPRREAQWTLPGRTTICLGRAGDACVVGALERVGDTLYAARVYLELGRRLAHAHAARKSRPDSLSRNRGGQSVGTIRGFQSPRRPGRRTQRIKARLLFVAQRIVEFREGGPNRLHCGKRGLQALLHRLDPTGRGERLVGWAFGFDPFPGLDGGILQFV